jgi:hypothetical protein
MPFDVCGRFTLGLRNLEGGHAGATDTAVRSDNLPMLRLCAADGLEEMFMQRMSGMTYLQKELEVVPQAVSHFAPFRVSASHGRTVPATARGLTAP